MMRFYSHKPHGFPDFNAHFISLEMLESQLNYRIWNFRYFGRTPEYMEVVAFHASLLRALSLFYISGKLWVGGMTINVHRV